MALVQYRCGLCHEVRGTSAGAITAPDLTHLMSRHTIAAGTLVIAPARWAPGSKARNCSSRGH